MDLRTNSVGTAKLTLAQRFFFRLLNQIQIGTVLIRDKTGEYCFSGKTQVDRKIEIDIHDTKVYQHVLLGGSLAASETYMQGLWSTDQLTTLIEVILQNAKLFEKIDGFIPLCLNKLLQCLNFFKPNTVKQAKQNILAHYDLGNEFFKLFLDPSLMYSAAIFSEGNADLTEASLYKIQRICKQINLKPTDHVIEIGTGWGSFAIYAAQHYGCKVTTTTISDKQYQFVKEKIRHLGLEKNITLLNQDYRNLTGTYDKLVSIEMIEAIGYQYFATFFKKCHSLVKPKGLFALQAILINDQAYNRAKTEVDFIRKYIFPGGCLPSMRVISEMIAKHTQFQLMDLKDIGLDYAKTLATWQDNFNRQIEAVYQQGFSESFVRMWRYYLSYCEGAFRQQYITDIQAVWRKR